MFQTYFHSVFLWRFLHRTREDVIYVQMHRLKKRYFASNTDINPRCMFSFFIPQLHPRAKSTHMFYRLLVDDRGEGSIYSRREPSSGAIQLVNRAFQFQDRRLWRGARKKAAERRRESHRHKDSYRPGNVEEEHEEAVLLSFSFSLSSCTLVHSASGRPFSRFTTI